MSSISIGDRFGRLVIQGRAPKGKHGHSQWYALCDCGATSITTSSSLVHSTTQSCGCLRRERLLQSVTTHGRTGTPEYAAYRLMMKRCTNEEFWAYSRYGGRGIFVCDRWMESFQNFLDDMGLKPSSNHSLERKDNDGPYSPDNCKWGTKIEQARNTSANKWITYNGETLCLAAWSEKIGIGQDALGARFAKGWTTERALTQPLRKVSKPQRRA